MPISSSIADNDRIDDARVGSGGHREGSNSSSSSNRNRSCWIDTDVGFDDLVAIRCCLAPAVAPGAGAIAIAGISTVGSGIVSDPFDGAAILRGLPYLGVGRDNDSDSDNDSGNESSLGNHHGRGLPSAADSDDRSDCCAARATAMKTKTATPVPRILAGNWRRLPSPAHDNDDDNGNDNDPPWLRECREQLKAFCSLEGIVLPSDRARDADTIGTGTLDSNRDSDNDSGSDDAGNDRACMPNVSKALTAAGFTGSNSNSNSDSDSDSDSDPIDLVCLGPLTNLACWLDDEQRQELSASDHNHHHHHHHRPWDSIWVLGGNLPVATDDASASPPFERERKAAEFNFARDPEAVRRVFTHERLRGATIHVVPQEVCDKHAFETSFLPAAWHPQQASGIKIGIDDGKRSGHMSPSLSAAIIVREWLESPSSQQQQAVTNGAKTKASTPPPLSPPPPGGAAVASSSTVSSLLPTWIKRLIQTRTYSVYGDPICIYIRDNCDDDRASNNRNGTGDDYTCSNSNACMNMNTNTGGEENRSAIRRRPRIVWKDYSTGGPGDPSKPLLEVDSHGRLVLVREAHTRAGALNPSHPPASAAHAHAHDHANATGFENERDNESVRRRISPGREPEVSPSFVRDSGDAGGNGVTIRIAHEVELGPIYLDWLTKALLSGSPNEDGSS
eukprot:jgi/Psemu1/48202/gm1.48202_g